MNATCPHCGCHGSLEVFISDNAARLAVAAVGKLPADMQRLIWPYLGLFRRPDAKNAMSWTTVNNRVAKLVELVNEPETQWKAQRVVPNHPRFWTEGMQIVLDTDALGKLDRPLDGHNYLRSVVYKIAERAWYQGTVHKEKEAQYRQKQPEQPAESRPKQQVQSPENYGAVPLSQGLKDWRKRVGQTSGEDK